MCQRATCQNCGKATYRGCGMHLEQVLSGVPASRRCTCEPGKGSPGSLFARLRGSRRS